LIAKILDLNCRKHFYRRSGSLLVSIVKAKHGAASYISRGLNVRTVFGKIGFDFCHQDYHLVTKIPSMKDVRTKSRKIDLLSPCP